MISLGGEHSLLCLAKRTNKLDCFMLLRHRTTLSTISTRQNPSSIRIGRQLRDFFLILLFHAALCIPSPIQTEPIGSLPGGDLL